MTDDEARKLAQRCIDTWPSGPKAYVWRDALIGLNPGQAAATYRRLVTEQDKPTVARFMAEYHSFDRPADTPWRGPDPGAIGFGEYLEGLQLRALKGSHEARAELDRWEAHLAGRHQYAARRGPTLGDVRLFERVPEAQCGKLCVANPNTGKIHHHPECKATA